MLQIQDSESTQLSFEQPSFNHQGSNTLNYVAQHPVLDLPFSSYFLLAVACSMVALGIWAAHFNDYFNFAEEGISALAWLIVDSFS